MLKAKGEKSNPNEVAKRILANLEKNDLIEKVFIFII
jgi:arginyl-tRNA synthetase